MVWAKSHTGWWFQPLWKMSSSVGIILPNIREVIKFMFQIVPNHQPAQHNGSNQHNCVISHDDLTDLFFPGHPFFWCWHVWIHGRDLGPGRISHRFWQQNISQWPTQGVLIVSVLWCNVIVHYYHVFSCSFYCVSSTYWYTKCCERTRLPAGSAISRPSKSMGSTWFTIR